MKYSPLASGPSYQLRMSSASFVSTSPPPVSNNSDNSDQSRRKAAQRSIATNGYIPPPSQQACGKCVPRNRSELMRYYMKDARKRSKSETREEETPSLLSKFENLRVQTPSSGNADKMHVDDDTHHLLDGGKPCADTAGHTGSGDDKSPANSGEDPSTSRRATEPRQTRTSSDLPTAQRRRAQKARFRLLRLSQHLRTGAR